MPADSADSSAAPPGAPAAPAPGDDSHATNCGGSGTLTLRGAARAACSDALHTDARHAAKHAQAGGGGGGNDEGGGAHDDIQWEGRPQPFACFWSLRKAYCNLSALGKAQGVSLAPRGAERPRQLVRARDARVHQPRTTKRQPPTQRKPCRSLTWRPALSSCEIMA
jgi:hypothetical protein